MKKCLAPIALSISILALSPLLINTKIEAAEIKVDEANVTIDDYTDDDLYVTGNTIEINDDVNGDIFAAGGQITLNDDIYGNLIVAGGTIIIEGTVRGSLFCSAGQVTINGDVNEDVVIAAGMVTLNGDVGDDVRIYGGTININSENIGDDLLVGAGSGKVSSDTEIGGDEKVNFGGTQDLETTNIKNLFLGFGQRSFVSILLGLARKFAVLLGWLIVGWLLFKFVPVKSRKITDLLADKKTSVKALLAGFALFASLIIIVPFLLVSVILGIGQPLALLMGVLFSLAVTIGGLYSATGIVRMIILAKKPKYKGYLLPMLIGVTVYQVLSWIPWIFCCLGPIVKLVITTWGVGGILLYKWRMIKGK
jgi:cytoskeletal protein CcmA (bactofilin family)